MSDLTIDEMKQKIERVKTDISRLSASGKAGRELEALTEYQAYLEDELKMMQNDQRTAK